MVGAVGMLVGACSPDAGPAAPATPGPVPVPAPTTEPAEAATTTAAPAVTSSSGPSSSGVVVTAPTTTEPAPTTTTEPPDEVEFAPEAPVDLVEWALTVAATSDADVIAEVLGSPLETGLTEAVWTQAVATTRAAALAGLGDAGWEAFPTLFPTQPQDPWQEVRVIATGAVADNDGTPVGVFVYSGVDGNGDSKPISTLLLGLSADGTEAIGWRR